MIRVKKPVYGKCVVTFCKNRNIPMSKRPKDYPENLSFFSLVPSRKQEWLKAIGKDENMSSSNVICSIHFRPEEIGKNQTNGKKFVKPGAVPSRFLRPSELIRTPSMFQIPDQYAIKTPIVVSSPMITSTVYPKLQGLQGLPVIKNMQLVITPGVKENSNNPAVCAESINYGPNNIINNVDGSSTESGEEGNEESEDIKIEIVDHDLNDEVSSLGINEQDVITIDDDVEENIPIHSLTTESQVQVTFLAGSDTAKEGLLKRKLKQLAENDVIKSKKIRELNNIIFLKNKLIGELRNEIAKLKDEQQKKPTQSPILRVLHPNSLK